MDISLVPYGRYCVEANPRSKSSSNENEDDADPDRIVIRAERNIEDPASIHTAI